jgi:hypothetical protein
MRATPGDQRARLTPIGALRVSVALHALMVAGLLAAPLGGGPIRPRGPGHEGEPAKNVAQCPDCLRDTLVDGYCENEDCPSHDD